MKVDKIIKVLEKEIDWSLEHPATNLSKDFQKGFGTGLKQAINLIKIMDEKQTILDKIDIGDK